MDGIVKRVAVAVLLLAVVCVAACGDESTQPAIGRTECGQFSWIR